MFSAPSGVSPVFPFLFVVGVQLGVPVAINGTLQAMSLLLVVLVKPVFAALADTFPSYRRLIFLMIISIMSISMCSITFIQPMHEDVRIEGQLVRAVEKSNDDESLIDNIFKESGPSYVESLQEENHRELVLRTSYNGKYDFCM